MWRVKAVLAFILLFFLLSCRPDQAHLGERKHGRVVSKRVSNAQSYIVTIKGDHPEFGIGKSWFRVTPAFFDLVQIGDSVDMRNYRIVRPDKEKQ